LPSIELRLPYEKEWEAACIVPFKTTIQDDRKIINFPWDKYTRSFLSEVPLTDSKGNYRANFGSMTDISGFSFKNYTDRADFVNKYPKRVLKNPKKLDKFHKKQIIKAKIMQQNKYGALQIYTNEVKVFGAYNGLYDMAGNVEEWTMDSPNFSKLNNIIFNWIESSINNTETFSMVIKSIDNNDYLTFYEILNDLNFKMNERVYDKFYVEEKKIRVNKLFNKWWKEAQIIKQGNRKIAKGGSWASGISHLLIASARAYEANKTYSFVGFRLAFSIDKEAK
jgi:hypothetical protein